MTDELPLPEPAGFSAGTHDCALFTLKRRTGKNFAKGAGEPLCEWYTADQMRAYGDARAAAELERCIFAAEQAYIDGRGAKGVIDAIRKGE